MKPTTSTSTHCTAAARSLEKRFDPLSHPQKSADVVVFETPYFAQDSIDVSDARVGSASCRSAVNSQSPAKAVYGSSLHTQR